MIPVTKPFLPPRKVHDSFLDTIWENNWLTNSGPLLNRLESDVQGRLETSNISFVTNGTIAIQIAIKALGITGEIITTPFSYVATTSAPAWEGCSLRFADIDPNSFNIDPDSIEAAITPKTQAILATHVFGNPIEVEKVADIAKHHDLKIIYDAAHCFGVDYDDVSIFEYGDVSTLSTHATKIFHTVEGGFIFSPDLEVRNSVNLMKNFGHDGPEVFSSIGINGKNSEFHAAMGLSNLQFMDVILAKRKAQYQLYETLLKGNNNLQFQAIHPKAKYNYSYFPVVFTSESVLLNVQSLLKENQIQPRRYFYPSLNKLDYVEYMPTPHAESIAERILCLPLFHNLEDKDINRICDLVLRAI